MARRRNLKCHICNTFQANMATCSTFRCTLSYCFQCIKSKFDQEFKPEKYVPSCWVCYSCGKSCKCDICNGVVLDHPRKVQAKPKSNSAPVLHQKSEEKIQKSESAEINKNIKSNLIKTEQNSEQIATQPKLDASYSIQPAQISNFSNLLTANIMTSAFTLTNNSGLSPQPSVEIKPGKLNKNEQLEEIQKSNQKQIKINEIYSVIPKRNTLFQQRTCITQNSRLDLISNSNFNIVSSPTIFNNYYQNMPMYYVLYYSQ